MCTAVYIVTENYVFPTIQLFYPSNQAAEGGNGQLTTFILPSNQAAEGGNGQLTIDNGRLTPHHDSAHSPSLLLLLTSPYSATSNLGPS